MCIQGESDEQLLARIISGMRNSSLKEKLLTEDDSKLKIEDVVNRLYAAERATVAAKELSSASATAEVHKVFQKKKQTFHKGKFVKKETTNRDVVCFCCGLRGHAKPDCRFKESGCFRCGEKGHTIRVCRQKPRRQGNNSVEQVEEAEEELQEKAVNYLLRMEADLAANKKAYLTVQLNNQPLEMEVDSGATFSLIGRQTFNEYFESDAALQPSKIKMQAWGQEKEITTAGKVSASVRVKEKGVVKLDLLVMDQDGPALIGRNWFEPLGVKLTLPDIEVEERKDEKKGEKRCKKEERVT